MQGRSLRTTRSAPLSRTWALLPCRTSASISWQKCTSRKSSPRATIEFVDIAGLVKGASKGEGLGNKFLSNIREVDAVVHVVRCFENDDIIHVEGSIDPARDIETIDLELILSDIEVLDRRIDKTKKMIKADKKYQSELEFFERVHEALDAGKPARSVACDEEEAELLASRQSADEQAHHFRRQHERIRLCKRH